MIYLQTGSTLCSEWISVLIVIMDGDLSGSIEAFHFVQLHQ